MSAKNTAQNCVLIIVVNGFDETETVATISILRQAGLCVKSVGLTSGLVASARGLQLLPDLTLSDLEGPPKTRLVRMVILPENEQSLARLEIDPRIHKFLRQVVAQRGQIAVGPRGMRFLKMASRQSNEVDGSDLTDASYLFVQETGQSAEGFARNLVCRLASCSRYGTVGK